MKFPKTTKKRVLLVVILLIIIGLITMAIRDNYRHNQLDSSINALQASLKDHGINTKKTNGCGRPYVEFGRGHKTCSIALNAQQETELLTVANEMMKIFHHH